MSSAGSPFLSSPLYQQMLAQTLSRGQPASEYPMQAGANTLAQLLTTYALKQNYQGQQDKAQALAASLIGTPQFNPVNVTPQMQPGDTVAARTAAGDYSAPAQSYSGPLGEGMDFNTAGALKQIAGALPPDQAFSLLGQTAQNQMERQNRLADLQTQSNIELGQQENLAKFNNAMPMSTAAGQQIAAQGAQAQQNALFNNNLPLSPKDRADLAEKQREFNASNPMLLGGGMAGGSGGGGGSTQLSSYPQPVQAMVQAMLDGRQAPPSSFALKTPYWQNLIALANSVDPTFDQTQWSSRVGARKDLLGGGKGYQNIQAANTAISHLGRLSDQTKDVSGMQVPLVGNVLNAGVNAVEQASGVPGVPAYNDTLQKLSQEATKLYRGTGGSESDIKEMQKNLGSSLSDAQKQAGIANTVHLFYGRIQSQTDAYNKAMGTNFAPGHFLSPQARATIQKMGFDPDTGDALPDQSAAPTPAQAHPAGNGAPVIIQNDADYNKLPSGTVFIGPDGKQRKKP